MTFPMISHRQGDLSAAELWLRRAEAAGVEADAVRMPIFLDGLPSGKHTKNDGKSPFSMGKSTISMSMFKFANC